MSSRLVICLMGLPRSGKSTVARALAQAWGAPVVNRDSIRLAMHLKPAEPLVRVFAKMMVEALFQAGHQIVIVDETNLKRATRDYWQDGDWATQFLPVETPFGECIRRADATKDSQIRPVIVQMQDYAEPLGDGEALYKVQHPDVFEAYETSMREELELGAGT